MLIVKISDMHVGSPGELYKDKVDTHAFLAAAEKLIASTYQRYALAPHCAVRLLKFSQFRCTLPQA